MSASFCLSGLVLALAVTASAQTPAPAPLTISLQDALARARQYGTQIQSANINAAIAREDRTQAKAATLPSLNAFNQFIYTEGNGTPSGVFVANDGVHIYNEQAQVHEELLSLARHGEIRRAMAAEAVAKAKAEVALRGLNATVIQDYYAIVSAQRRFANAQTSLREAGQFLDISQKQEKGGEVAHADVIKAQITQQQRQRDLEDAELSIEKAKIALGVLIFPDFRSDFAVEDDLAQPVLLPPLPEARAKATATSPDLKAAQAGVEQAGYEVNIARYAYLPSLGLDFFYGIDANQFAARTDHPTEDTGRSTLPQYEVPFRQNLGYSAQVTLNIPVWNWGATRSKIKQAALKQQQAELDLTLAQRTLQGNIASAYREAQTAQAQVDSLRSSSDLSAESLRLTLLRYQAGEANALEVVDAQTTLAQARNAYDDGLARYRVAIANLQTLTGN
ncbi:MAG TPA: TolC family protein [Bryobacteraceae bacterium]|jgi:outer membrane protein TolC|nr:TolC family protein [Bryobacteraceae bacterium]